MLEPQSSRQAKDAEKDDKLIASFSKAMEVDAIKFGDTIVRKLIKTVVGPSSPLPPSQARWTVLSQEGRRPCVREVGPV